MTKSDKKLLRKAIAKPEYGFHSCSLGTDFRRIHVICPCAGMNGNHVAESAKNMDGRFFVIPTEQFDELWLAWAQCVCAFKTA